MKELKLRISKCKFAQKKITLLGYVVNEHGVEVDASKVRLIRNTPRPSNKSELSSFLGIAGYYHRFIRSFAYMSASLHTMKSVGVKLGWTAEMEVAFKQLKAKLTSPSVLAFPHLQNAFVVETDHPQ